MTTFLPHLHYRLEVGVSCGNNDEYVKDQKEKFAQAIKNLQNAWTDFYDYL